MSTLIKVCTFISRKLKRLIFSVLKVSLNFEVTLMDCVLVKNIFIRSPKPMPLTASTQLLKFNLVPITYLGFPDGLLIF